MRLIDFQMIFKGVLISGHWGDKRSRGCHMSSIFIDNVEENIDRFEKGI